MIRPRPIDLPDAVTTRAQLRAGQIRADAVLTAYLGRLDAHQATLNGATQIFRDAAVADRDGPLAGLPISVKETFSMADEALTVGSLRRPVAIPTADAVIVQRLRAASAIIIARSNVPELAMTGETTNLRFGRTNNYLDPSRTAGGSSGGEGALVASGSSIAGVGSDLLGSIRIPAAFNGIVGFKAASGAIDKTGVWPDLRGLYADSLLALGTLTRSVRDAQLLYDSIAHRPISPLPPLTELRLMVPKPFVMRLQSPAIAAALARARQHLGQQLREEVQPFADVAPLFKQLLAIIATELGPRLTADLTTANGERLSLAREAFNQLRGRPSIDSGLFQLLLTAPWVGARAVQLPALYNAVDAARAHYHRLLGDDSILLLPTLGLIAPPHGAMNRASLRPGVNGTVTSLTFCNLINLPAITLPAWSDPDPASGMPPGIMLACAPGSEAALLAAARYLEPALNPNAAPSDG
jgi:aspartyl-tRNA(Asn)/glutamyl-tRNA(Gln) amidotransferase subunit A/fatty acid amide hydrolase 2